MNRKTLLVLITALTLLLGSAFASPAGKKKAAEKSTPATSQGAAACPGPGKVDLNSANKQDLMNLKGVGDAYADKIIQNRPYKAKNDLVKKKVVPQHTYDEIRECVIAHQDTASSKGTEKSSSASEKSTPKKK